MTKIKIVNSSNLALLLGITKEQAACKISRLKKKHKKPPFSILTLKEFCDYNGLNYEEIDRALN